ncbi:type IV pilus modification protein PilV [Thalassotalea aquiviva]|uniref:type IV pilus modification protein PilV n=1 Tax=Thalassotalea aquiviva TaxID=3242415 RepID=UPI00352BC6D9
MPTSFLSGELCSSKPMFYRIYVRSLCALKLTRSPSPPCQKHLLLRASPVSGSGFSLLEVLVALFIVGFAMLSVLKLNLSGLQHMHQAHHENQANLLSQQLLHMVQNNLSAKNSYALTYGQTINASADCAQTRCSEIELAHYEINRWQTHLFHTIPGAVALVKTTDKTLFVSIYWQLEKKTNSTLCPAPAQNYQCVEFELRL